MRFAFPFSEIALIIALATITGAQTPKQQKTGTLELLLQPEAGKRAVPQGFTVVLVNNADHDVRVPMPTVECHDPYNGYILLMHDFKPLKPGPPPMESGCFRDTVNWPPIMDRVKDWKLMHPGDSLRLKVDAGELFYDDTKPGRYEFWAVYFPPGGIDVDVVDQNKLQESGIDFPHSELTTPHIVFEKKR